MVLDTEIFKPCIKVCEIQNFFSNHSVDATALRSTLSNCSGKTYAASKEVSCLLSERNNPAFPNSGGHGHRLCFRIHGTRVRKSPRYSYSSAEVASVSWKSCHRFSRCWVITSAPMKGTFLAQSSSVSLDLLTPGSSWCISVRASLSQGRLQNRGAMQSGRSFASPPISPQPRQFTKLNHQDHSRRINHISELELSHSHKLFPPPQK